MFENFSSRHILPLLIGGATTFGGVWTMFDARGSMLKFGLPASVADQRVTHPIWVIGHAKATVLGLLCFIFYSQGKYAEVDTVLVVFGGWSGVVDSYVVWKSGKPGMALFRIVGSWLIAA